MSFSILLYERMHERGMKLLEQVGDITIAGSLREDALMPLFARADAAIVRAAGNITRRLMENAPGLKVVGRHGAGVDNIDVQAATELGVWVVNTPAGPSESLTELFFLLALSLCRQFGKAQRGLRRGDWNVRHRAVGSELQDKTVGIVGLGRTGRLIAQKCRAAFNCRILYYDPIPAPPEVEKACGAQLVTLQTLMADSDFITLQVPLTEQTRHMIGADEIALMKPTAFLLNLCRGPVWDEGAVLRCLIDRRIAGAASDVFEEEPPGRVGQMLLRLTNFVGTPHIGGSTIEAMERMSLVAEDVVRILKGEAPKLPVNKPARPRTANEERGTRNAEQRAHHGDVTA